MTTRGTQTFTLQPVLYEHFVVEKGKVASYEDVFDSTDDLGSLLIRVGANSKTTSLAEAVTSLAGLVRHRLMEPLLLGKRAHWERILSEDWKLNFDRSGPQTALELKRVSRVIPMDDEIESSPIDLGEVRDAFAGLLEKVSSALEARDNWLKSVPGRDVFLRELDRFKNLHISTQTDT